MTHSEALNILTAWIATGGPNDPEQAAAAEEHVADCGKCWEELFEIGRALRVGTPEIDERMRALLGCEAIVGQLYKVAGLDMGQVAQRFPRIAAHLGRCGACQDVLTDLEALPIAEPEPSTAMRWKDVLVAGGERVRELVGDLAFRVREGLIAGQAWPDGLILVPLGGAMRGGDRPRGGGDEPVAGAEARGHRFRLDLDTIDLGVELLIESHPPDRVRLEVQVLRGERPVSVALYRVEGDQEQVVARRDAAPSKNFVAPNLQPGTYHLEVRDRPTAVRRRIRLLLE